MRRRRGIVTAVTALAVMGLGEPASGGGVAVETTPARYGSCLATQAGGVLDCPGPLGREQNALRIGRRVTFYDSFGRRVAVVRRTGKASHRIFHGDRTYYVSRRYPLVYTNKRACGRGPGVARVFAGFDASRRRGVDTRLQFRGFIRPRDLIKPRPGYSRRCPRAQGVPVDEAPLAFRTEPVFHSRDGYDRPGRDLGRGDTYGSYAARAGGSIYLSASTVEVRRGGVPVAVVSARADAFTRTGYFTSCDRRRLARRDAARTKPVVSWSFGFVRHAALRIYGWVPTQALHAPATDPPLAC